MNDSSRNENILLTDKVHAFNKFFYVDYKENQRGRFLKITEKDGRFRSTVIIPEEAVDDLSKLLSKISEDFSPAERTAEQRKEIEARRQEFESRRSANAETKISENPQDSFENDNF